VPKYVSEINHLRSISPVRDTLFAGINRKQNDQPHRGGLYADVGKIIRPFPVITTQLLCSLISLILTLNHNIHVVNQITS